MSEPRTHRPHRPPADPEKTIIDRDPTGTAAAAFIASARDLVQSGQHARAFPELLKALRAGKPDAALCAEVLRVARKAGLEVAASAALEDAWQEAAPPDRIAFHRALARLWRRQGRLDQARLHLYQLLAERPEDRRAQAALAHGLAREGRYQELCQALARAGAQADAARRHTRAHAAHLTRGRLWSTPLGDPERSAEAFADAATSAARAKDPEAAYDARLLALNAQIRASTSDDAQHLAAERLRESAPGASSPEEAERAAQVLASGGPDAARLLIERAVLAEARKAQAEAVALWEAALEANPAAADAAERLARLLTARKAWSELAEFCGRQAERATSPDARVAALRQRAEVLERHLKDPGGSAQAWAEVFKVTGEAGALAMQLERLERAGGTAAADAALDRAVAQAPDLPRKAAALKARADRHLAQRRFALAAADLQRLSQLQPLSPAEHRRLCECRAEEGDPGAIKELWELSLSVRPNEPGRTELFRRLARLSAWPLGDAEKSRQAWSEVLAEQPGDPEAEERLLQLARARNRPDELVPILRARATRLGRGPEARQARHDLARLLERLGKMDDGLQAWRAAAASRARRRRGPAGTGRAPREARRARRGRAGLRGRGPRPRRSPAHRAKPGPAWPSWLGGSDTTRGWRRPKVARGRWAWSSPSRRCWPSCPFPGRPRSASRPRARRASAPRRFGADPLARSAPNELLQKLEDAPLETKVHRALSDHFDRKGDVLRASLFTEVAHALEGDPDAEPLAPKGTLSATSLLALRHPDLKGVWVEALHLAGEALVAEAARERKMAPFSMDAGKGAPGAAQALLDAVRILGQRAPDVVLSPEEGPPFALEHTDPVQLSVGRAAVKKEWSPGELRFFAARALYSLAPELLALRLLDVTQLGTGMKRVLENVQLPRNRMRGPATQINPKARERLLDFFDDLKGNRPQWESLMLAARHAANRAGFVVAAAWRRRSGAPGQARRRGRAGGAGEVRGVGPHGPHPRRAALTRIGKLRPRIASRAGSDPASSCR